MKRHTRLGVAELRWLRQLEDETKKLKQLVANLSLAKAMPRHAAQKTV